MCLKVTELLEPNQNRQGNKQNYYKALLQDKNGTKIFLTGFPEQKKYFDLLQINQVILD
jgi:hypothetical protein